VNWSDYIDNSSFFNATQYFEFRVRTRPVLEGNSLNNSVQSGRPVILHLMNVELILYVNLTKRKALTSIEV
jgi:hypothetical protein